MLPLLLNGAQEVETRWRKLRSTSMGKKK